MATNRRPQVRPPVRRPQGAPPVAPEPTVTVQPDEPAPVEPVEVEAAVDTSDVVSDVDVIMIYPRVRQNDLPPDSYVIDTDSPIQEDWFEVSDGNDNIVIPKLNILRRVVPENCVTPTYVLVAPAGTVMSKQLVAGLQNPAGIGA